MVHVLMSKVLHSMCTSCQSSDRPPVPARGLSQSEVTGKEREWLSMDSHVVYLQGNGTSVTLHSASHRGSSPPDLPATPALSPGPGEEEGGGTHWSHAGRMGSQKSAKCQSLVVLSSFFFFCHSFAETGPVPPHLRYTYWF